MTRRSITGLTVLLLAAIKRLWARVRRLRKGS